MFPRKDGGIRQRRHRCGRGRGLQGNAKFPRSTWPLRPSDRSPQAFRTPPIYAPTPRSHRSRCLHPGSKHRSHRPSSTSCRPGSSRWGTLAVSAAATGSLEGAGAGKRNAAGFARRDAAAWVIDAVAGPAAGLSGGRQATAVLGADRASWLPRRRVEHSPAEQAVAEAVAFADEIARMEGNDRVDLGLEHFASEARYAGPE